MKNVLRLLCCSIFTMLLCGTTPAFAKHNGGNTSKDKETGKKYTITGVDGLVGRNDASLIKVRDTFSLNCLLTSPELFYGAELGEKKVKDKVDSLVGTISYESSKRISLVILSAADLGFKNQNDVQWSDVLDSAISRGYEVCPAQIGPELFVMAENHTKYVRMPKLPADKPIFIGMPEIRKTVHHKFLGIHYKQDEAYVFCLKAQGKNKAYKLGYSTTNTEDKDYFWSSEDLFVFARCAK